ncbi:MAG: hypothetical protein LC138_07125 [Anaerolineales bacterium]|nr:hypothetical protein [Anaerolineales bacterium]
MTKSAYVKRSEKMALAGRKGRKATTSKRGRSAAERLQRRIDAVVAKALEVERSAAGVDVMHDYRRGFNWRGMRARKVG